MNDPEELAPAPPTHPWLRFVALGDSFTEGVGDEEPDAPNGVRGWADRVAEQLALTQPDFAYANLAIRGKLLDQISDEQIDAAIELQPDLITLCAGGNDLVRIGSEPDALAARFERVIERLERTGATILIFTGVDTKFSSAAFRMIRPSVAIYNEHLRGIAQRHGLLVADQWNLKSIQKMRMWSPDRLHLNPLGHHEIARMVLEVLGVPNELKPMAPEPMRPQYWREARMNDAAWIRDHVVPWVGRRLRHVSSGDEMLPKRPLPEHVTPFAAGVPRPAESEGQPLTASTTEPESSDARPLASPDTGDTFDE